MAELGLLHDAWSEWIYLVLGFKITTPVIPAHLSPFFNLAFISNKADTLITDSFIPCNIYFKFLLEYS